MDRKEFIENAKTLNDDQLQEIAEASRKRAEGRIPEETQQIFRSLDGRTECRDINVETSFGNTHLFLVRKRNVVGNLPVVINVHGGGWCLSHGERDIYFSRRMALKLNCLVIDVDYVLAPEYPYPAAIEQLEALMNSLPANLPAWGGDVKRIALCGQSSGGNLLAALLVRNRINVKVQGALLCYLPADNYNDHFHGEQLDERGMSTEYYGFFYNRNFEERKNPDVSLVYASSEQLSSFPSTEIITAGKDNLCQEGTRFYELLKENGVNAGIRCFTESRHGFLINLYDEWQEAETYAAERLAEMLK